MTQPDDAPAVAGRPVDDLSWRSWLAAGLVLALTVCAAPVVFVVSLVGRMAEQVDGSGVVPQPRWAAATPSPRPGDPPQVRAAWLGLRIRDALDRQADALLDGDEAAFVAVADPGSPAVADLRRQFRALRALGVVTWRPEVRTDPAPIAGTAGRWRLPVGYQHCFGDTGCRPGPVTIGTQWRETPDGPALVAVEPSADAPGGPRPWEASELVVVRGQRVVVATTAAYRSMLPGLRDAAERAAVTSDRYAVGARVDRYHVYYAGPAQWRRWYGGDRPPWTAGYAVAVGGGRYDVVLNAEAVRTVRLGDLLLHEMTHAASLPADGYADRRLWWLVEGLAEYAAAGGRPVGRYHALPAVRRYVSVGWDGRLDSLAAGGEAASWQVSGSYGASYLAVRHLVDRFGEDRVLDFFTTVVHGRRPLPEASRRAFGESWDVLHAQCVAYLRSVAG